MKDNLKQGLKLIGLGSFIFLFCVGWGINYLLIMYSLSSFYNIGYIDKMTYNFGLFGVPLIGVSVVIIVVLYCAFGITKEPLRCKTCNSPQQSKEDKK